MTTESSANDQFWSLLVTLGWGRSHDVDPQIKAALPTSRSYGFAEETGARKLVAWLRHHFKRREQ